MRLNRVWLTGLTVALAVLGSAVMIGPAKAVDSVEFRVATADPVLRERLRAASLVDEARRDGRHDGVEVLAAARADYGRLIGVLYGEGFYGPAISILADGREVAGIAPLNAPARIRSVVITVTPGPAFVFGQARIAPLVPATRLPEAFRSGAPAPSGVLRVATDAAVDGWREAGHAKAAIGAQSLVADHRRVLLDADIRIAPGPQARFGRIAFTGAPNMRPERLAAIAGLPEGAVYAPATVRRVAERLRRSGVFRSVSIVEAERLGPGDRLDLTAALEELPPRRIGASAEVSTTEGLALSGFWLHRNLRGGAERLRVEAEISRIGLLGDRADFALGARLERPATFTPDTTADLLVRLERRNTPDFTLDQLRVGGGLAHRFSDTLSARLALEYTITRETGAVSEDIYRTLSLPAELTWDRRDNPSEATSGTYLAATATPFFGLSGAGGGLRVTADARAYRALGSRIVLAGRVQGGVVAGPPRGFAPPDYLFFSGGGGTVRGQPYQSLSIIDRNALRRGASAYAAASLELRGQITERIGLVGFADIGAVSDPRFAVPEPGWHGGVGLGLRYATPVGPLRLDVAAPAGGRTGRGVQVYIGIGQAF